MARKKEFGWFDSFKRLFEGNSSATNVRVLSVVSWLSQRYCAWSEFFDAKNMGLPKLDGVIPRIQHNLATFTFNYVLLFGVLLVSSNFSNFYSIFLDLQHSYFDSIDSRVDCLHRLDLQYSSEDI
jgi:hypothetical protein